MGLLVILKNIRILFNICMNNNSYDTLTIQNV